MADVLGCNVPAGRDGRAQKKGTLGFVWGQGNSPSMGSKRKWFGVSALVLWQATTTSQPQADLHCAYHLLSAVKAANGGRVPEPLARQMDGALLAIGALADTLKAKVGGARLQLTRTTVVTVGTAKCAGCSQVGQPMLHTHPVPCSMLGCGRTCITTTCAWTVLSWHTAWLSWVCWLQHAQQYA